MAGPADRQGGSSSQGDVQYRNPFRGVRGLTAERIDMGVDYSGTGPVYALGPGVITAAGNQWAGAVGAPYPGTWIQERITAGPLRGKQIYVAEDIYNVRVHPGQHVTSSTVLGDLQGGLETGFAAGPPGETSAAAAGQQATGGDPGAHPTAYGEMYSKVLAATGAPPGVGSGRVSGGSSRIGGNARQPGQGGSVWDIVKAAWAGVSQTDPLAGEISAGSQDISSTAGSILALAAPITKAVDAIDWLFHPNHWIRIFAGIGGSVFTLMGVWNLSHVGGQASTVTVAGTSVPTSAGGTLALPIGILEVGLGGVLLFVAFHNLPSSVKTFPDFLAHLRDEVQKAPSKPPVAA